LKILLSAYACEPNRGSEQGIGWNWALELANLGHEVHVLTRANNRPSISNTAKALPATLRFHYYDPPKRLTFWKRGGRGVYLYSWLWQIGAARVARVLQTTERFDIVHHITLGSPYIPSFMGNLGVKFIMGPLGGGETAPLQLRSGYSLRGHLVDALRDLASYLIKFSPMFIRNQRQATRILLRSHESARLIQLSERWKIELVVDVGATPAVESTSAKRGEGLALLYVGRFLHWKGLHLALEALARLRSVRADARLTLVGAGPEEPRLRRVARELGVGTSIRWISWVPHNELDEIYRQHDIFVFPSLHDSGGLVICEAAANGLPIVCLDLGGPGTIVSQQCGFKVPARDRTKEDVIRDLSSILLHLNDDASALDALKDSALAWARQHSWAHVVRSAYGSDVSKVGSNAADLG
jgi:glycosyltransferase involved in cell wall biosynthesis